jgi:valyl-tRNA synthetase
MAEIAKAYEPASVEEKWTSRWIEGKAFAAAAQPEKEPHCIMIPPPNVTGMLHMGHILNNTLQDIFTRRARLEGKEALWFPGTDHAGIATQTRVEKKIRQEDGLHRRDLGREKFVEKVWEWKEEHGGIILNQLRKLGASCDWDRTSFTLDEGYSRAVLHAFVELYRRGYVYRGLRMSNWCPVSQTALSNEEVINKPQKGLLYKMRYEIVERPGQYVEISTTRPETLMGDVAVAVHPDDERYLDIVGLHVRRPFPEAEIPVIADTAVQIDFGTGCLKITPAHDALDFAVGQRHKLPIIDVFNPDGTLNELAGPEFAGMDRFAARKAAARKLEEMGLLVGTEDYENNIGFSERADVPVEPRLTEQWWLRYPKVAEAKRAVTAGLLRFHPERWAKTYLHWLETMERDQIDWCISRQLWWGHRIPVWYRKGLDRAKVDYSDPTQVHVSVDGPPDPENWEQEEDVLDTWASSWLWPFANFGWPGDDPTAAAELKYFYPTSTLVTGFDIIFLWVARMVMAGLEFMGEAKETLTDEEIAARLPFRDVYMTGLIRDDKRRKMSKSLGNSPDPLDLIAKVGADGLRFGIVNIAPSGQDILFGEDRVEVGRNFCNKLWNACRFRQMSGPLGDNSSLEAILGRIDAARLDTYDRWILARLLQTIRALETAFARFDMSTYPKELYEFFWSDYCDWYIEASKAKLRGGESQETTLALLDLLIRQTLLLAEPLIPFITEELWESLGYRAPGHRFLQETRLPAADELEAALRAHSIEVSPAAVEEINRVKETIARARALKSEYNVANRRDVPFIILAEPAARAVLESHRETCLALIPAESFTWTDAPREGMPAAVTTLGTLYLDLSAAIDVEAEKERLTKELAKLAKGIQAGESKLANPGFVKNAPPAVIEGARKQLAETQARKAELERLLASL